MYLSRKSLYSACLLAVSLVSSAANAGGITIGGTRVVYPADKKQVSMSVRNTSDTSTFMVQSWVENADGNKSQDFVVTPPVYVSGPGNENTLRIMYAGRPARTDQETLYFLNTKAIPSMDRRETEDKNILMLAATTRIKLFVRPAGLTPTVEKAPEMLTFHKAGTQLRIDNPTPYHITLASIKVDGKSLPDSMVNPRSSLSVALPAGTGNIVTYRTINDFGAATPEARKAIK
ncbi:fimbria/pilus periplasmic chaperone [Cronobacter dublinensis]|uniref:Fimbrial chaperone protein n=1 Tax=Cronobacter dublinensis TaxID=413497 RepID=A0A9Q4T2F0_9ENTR|nr:fimbria/pilus periplasmic chaperone [Cronobacter dublinensis]NCH88970.1 fimbrial chaperone protein [Cronobacter dublinensis]